MRFSSPALLWTLLAIPFAVALYLHRERRPRGVPFGRPEMMPNVVPVAPGWRRHLAPALYFVALLAMLFALARPELALSRPRERGTVVLAIDTSRSMDSSDIAPSRLSAARRAAGVLLREAPEGFDIGVVAFDREARVLSLPIRDRWAVADSLESLDTRRQTAIGDGIAGAVETIPVDRTGWAHPDAAVVLLSDGNNTTGLAPKAAIAEAKAAGVDVHLVALGASDGGESSTELRPANFDYLKGLSEMSGGLFATATSEAELAEVYGNLGSTMLTEKEWEDVTPAVAGAGAVALVVGAALGILWFNRLA